MEVIHDALARGRVLMPYNFERFESDMLASGLLVDARTIQTKWKMLIASKIVIEKRTETRGVVPHLDLSTFYMWMSPAAQALLESARRGESERVINTVDEVRA